MIENSYIVILPGAKVLGDFVDRFFKIFQIFQLPFFRLFNTLFDFFNLKFDDCDCISKIRVLFLVGRVSELQRCYLSYWKWLFLTLIDF